MRRALLIASIVGAAIGARADPLDAVAGKALFERLWVPAPASTDAADGLGPLFNARSCASCHPRGGGAKTIDREGRPDIVGAVVRFGTANGAADPTFGLQLQTNAVPGLAVEGVARFLPRLDYALEGGELADGMRAGARVAPPLAGRAEFDLVADAEILKRADPDDSDGDGVSGRANRGADGAIGRFGWKSARATLPDQIAHALALDLGLSSPRAPLPAGDCTERQAACLSAPNGESAAFEGREASNAMIGLMAAYVATLHAPPAKADASGAALFAKTGCAACHAPELETKNGGLIAAFTDLLLHDMGGALDDGVGEPGVTSSEWRTAPLIGAGALTSSRRYLHDGSAATVSEAIAKHGGEGEASRQAFERLAHVDRQRLIKYVLGL